MAKKYYTPKGFNPKVLQNLKPAVKGEVRNKTGRPKKLPKLDELLAEVLGSMSEEGKTEAQNILEALLKKANQGDVKAIGLLLDRGWGRVKEHIDITTNEESLNDNKIQIEIITQKKDEQMGN
jgi:hypothetical protein